MFCSVFTKNCLKGLGGASTVWRFKGQLGEEERVVFLSVCVCVCVCGGGGVSLLIPRCNITFTNFDLFSIST